MVRSRYEEHSIGDDIRRGGDEVRSLGAAVAEITEDLRVLAQKERDLARAEVTEQISLSVQAGVWSTAAAVFGMLLLAFLALTLMFALDTALPLWLSALITSGVLLVLTAMAALIARSRMKRVTVTPQRTLASLRKDMRWLRGLMQPNGQ